MSPNEGEWWVWERKETNEGKERGCTPKRLKGKGRVAQNKGEHLSLAATLSCQPKQPGRSPAAITVESLHSAADLEPSGLLCAGW